MILPDFACLLSAFLHLPFKFPFSPFGERDTIRDDLLGGARVVLYFTYLSLHFGSETLSQLFHCADIHIRGPCVLLK
jgi:hypothetical protein